MNNEFRSVRLSGDTTVSVTLSNATHESMEKLFATAKYFSDESFIVETHDKAAYKRVKLIFKEPDDARAMLKYVSEQMYNQEAN